MPSFIGFELTIVGLFLVVGWHITRNTICHRVEYLLAFLYALMFEELDIRLFHTYQYGEGYTLVLGQVPIVIAFAWAVILYTSMAMSDSWKSPTPPKLVSTRSWPSSLMYLLTPSRFGVAIGSGKFLSAPGGLACRREISTPGCSWFSFSPSGVGSCGDGSLETRPGSVWPFWFYHSPTFAWC